MYVAPHEQPTLIATKQMIEQDAQQKAARGGSRIKVAHNSPQPSMQPIVPPNPQLHTLVAIHTQASHWKLWDDITPMTLFCDRSTKASIPVVVPVALTLFIVINATSAEVDKPSLIVAFF